MHTSLSAVEFCRTASTRCGAGVCDGVGVLVGVLVGVIVLVGVGMCVLVLVGVCARAEKVSMWQC